MNTTYYSEHQEEMKQKTQHNNGGVNQKYQLLNKTEVRIAADYTCQRCGKKAYGSQLAIHHIIPCEMLAQRNDEVDNLVCLCNTCHQSLHYLIKDITDIDELKEFTEAYISGDVKSIKELKRDRSNQAKARQKEINALLEELNELKAKRKRLIAFRNQCTADRRNAVYLDRWRDIGKLVLEVKEDLAIVNEDIHRVEDRLKALREQKHIK